MSVAIQSESDIGRAVSLLGGEETIRARVRNAMDAHQVLLRGLPEEALLHMVSSVGFLGQGDMLKKAVGLSLRTLQRHRAGQASNLLSVEQSSRTWRFAEIFAQAIEVMGSRDAAEAWMSRPATGLSNLKPVDLLATSAGAEAVEEHLTRLEYGVYT